MMRTLRKTIIAAFVISLFVLPFRAFAEGTVVIHAPAGASVDVYLAGMVDASGNAQVYSWYVDEPASSRMSDAEIAASVTDHFSKKYADKVGTFYAGDDGVITLKNRMDAVYYFRSGNAEPAAVTLPHKDPSTGALSYEVSVTVGTPPTETAAAEPGPAAETAAEEGSVLEETASMAEETRPEETSTAAEEKALPDQTVTVAEEETVPEETVTVTEEETVPEETVTVAEEETVPDAAPAGETKTSGPAQPQGSGTSDPQDTEKNTAKSQNGTLFAVMIAVCGLAAAFIGAAYIHSVFARKAAKLRKDALYRKYREKDASETKAGKSKTKKQSEKTER